MLLLALILALLATAPGAFAVTPAISGAEPGVWTQDYDAAIALARSRSLPAIINFTGSDWCGWCRLMDRQVFSTDAFADWARGRVVLIWIDFPSDPSLVPEKWRQRNQDLQRQHNVRGYPTYIALNSSGDVAGQLGASRDATPKAFTSRFEALVGALPPPRPAAPSLSPDPAKSLRFSSSDDALKPLVSIASDLVSRLEAATAAASASIADIRGQMARALEKGKAAAMAKGDLDAALQFDAVLKDPDASPPEPAPSLRKILSVRDKAVGDVTASLNARRASILAAALSRLDADKLRETR
ncbi:MAG: thioredoxin family protein, partial [Kiritimatiellae bacterium]|nr:thioredoxin family protein [Kiritimatiellia bacterium]